MKRILALILALLMMLSLVSCDLGILKKDDDDKTPSKNEDKPKDEISIDEVVAIDNDECSVKVTKLVPGDYKYAIKVQLENKSSEKAYTFSIEYLSINGIDCDAFLSEDVTPGKKANAEISVYDVDVLEKNGVGDFTDIEIAFCVSEVDVYDEYIAYEITNVYPYGKDKAIRYTREPKSSDKLIADNQYFSATITGEIDYDKDDYYGYGLDLYLVNKTDKVIVINTKNEAVNGFMVSPVVFYLLAPGKSAFLTVEWSKTDLEDNDIKTVEEVEFIFIAYESGSWGSESDSYVYETVTIKH